MVGVLLGAGVDSPNHRPETTNIKKESRVKGDVNKITVGKITRGSHQFDQLIPHMAVMAYVVHKASLILTCNFTVTVARRSAFNSSISASSFAMRSSVH
jgi:hypothetical protein